MNKHEQARKYVDDIDGSGYFQRLHNYINEAEATEKEYEEEKKQHQYDIKYMNKVAEDLTKELENTKYQLSVVKDNALKIQNQLVELQRDVNRFLKLRSNIRSDDETIEMIILENKLSKGGVEE